MQRTIQKVTALVASYNEKLEARGICIEVSRKYFETSAHSYLPSRPTLIDYFIENKLDMREKKKGYGYRKNSFYCIVLRLCPIDSALVPGRLCREYSFVIKSTTRMYIGETPKEKRAPEEKLLAKIENDGGRYLFTGDTLFAGSIGRTDFPTGSLAQLRESLKRLSKLDGDIVVYPGHEEETTIARERQTNPFLADM